jgi:hypothetical protein
VSARLALATAARATDLPALRQGLVAERIGDCGH